MSDDVDCASCGDGIDTLTQTHYRVTEEERPVAQLEKATDELEVDDFFARGWLLCRPCMTETVDSVTGGDE